MDINEDEVKEVSKIGTLNGDEVKIVTLKGGLHIGIGKKSENSNKAAILAVGSHPALVSYQISKKYDQKFEQIMNKNEKELLPEVSNNSNNLSSTEKNVLGLDIYTIKNGQEIDFKITKHNFEIFSIKANQLGDYLSLDKIIKNEERLTNLNKKELSEKLEKTIKKFAKSNKLRIKKNF
jgi:hypothetical protein